MIITGDLVFPIKFESSCLGKIEKDFLEKNKLVNLESTIGYNEFAKKQTPGIALSSDKSVYTFMKKINVKCVSLANNHLLDFDYVINDFKTELINNDISSFGAGGNLDEALEPYLDHKEKIIINSFGWDVIRCQYAKKNKQGVAPYKFDTVKKTVRLNREAFPHYKYIVIFHWNYEFEQYPQPADRDFSKYLIDIGVDAIVGHHAHIIQGYEKYKGKYIFYGLGNFYFNNYRYAGFSLNFPDIANFGMSVDFSDSEPYVYITKLSNNKTLELIEQGKPNELQLLQDLSKFSCLESDEYITFFKKNRVKNKLLPIFKQYENVKINCLKRSYVKLRQVLVDLKSKL